MRAVSAMRVCAACGRKLPIGLFIEHDRGRLLKRCRGCRVNTPEAQLSSSDAIPAIRLRVELERRWQAGEAWDDGIYVELCRDAIRVCSRSEERALWLAVLLAHLSVWRSCYRRDPVADFHFPLDALLDEPEHVISGVSELVSVE